MWNTSRKCGQKAKKEEYKKKHDNMYSQIIAPGELFLPTGWKLAFHHLLIMPLIYQEMNPLNYSFHNLSFWKHDLWALVMS